MKFVFALALVALCVILIQSRPNIKRDSLRIQKRAHRQGPRDDPSSDSESEENEAERAEAGHGDSKREVIADRIAKRAHRQGPRDDPSSSSESEENEAERAEAGHGDSKRAIIADRIASSSSSSEEDEDSAEAESGQQERKRDVGSGSHHINKRAATNLMKTTLWPVKEIYYTFKDGAGEKKNPKKAGAKDPTLEAIVKTATDELTRASGLKFKMCDPQNIPEGADPIEFVIGATNEGCYANIGYLAKKNKVTLELKCIDVGTVIHEILHILGLWHEAQRGDRDKFVGVDKTKIVPGLWDQFKELDGVKVITSKDLHINASLQKYDECSVMHYYDEAFKKEGATGKTINVKDPEYAPCINANSLSCLDGKACAALYDNIATEGQDDCLNSGYKLKGHKDCTCCELFEGPDCKTLKSNSLKQCTKEDEKTNVYVVKKNEKKKITTHEGPQGDYEPNIRCAWQFKTVDKDTKLCASFASPYKIEGPSTTGKCAFDYIMAFTDDDKLGQGQRYCGEHEKLEYLDQTDIDHLVIVLVSDSEYTERGFTLCVQGVDLGTDCKDVDPCKAGGGASGKSTNGVAVAPDSEESYGYYDWYDDGFYSY